MLLFITHALIILHFIFLILTCFLLIFIIKYPQLFFLFLGIVEGLEVAISLEVWSLIREYSHLSLLRGKENTGGPC